MYPQAVYFPTRTLYFTHKIEYRERCKNSESLAAANKQSQTNDTTQSNNLHRKYFKINKYLN